MRAEIQVRGGRYVQAGSADHVDIAEMAKEPESASPGADSFLRALNEQHWGIKPPR